MSGSLQRPRFDTGMVYDMIMPQCRSPSAGDLLCTWPLYGRPVSRQRVDLDDMLSERPGLVLPLFILIGLAGICGEGSA